MIAKKICLLGSFAVGKTSIVRRFTESIFDEKYQTTIGVKIDKKLVSVNGHSIQLMIWDMEGRDEFNHHRVSYLRGAAGYFIVADTTRPDSLKVAIELQQELELQLGKVPFLLLLSKADLQAERRLDQSEIKLLTDKNWQILETSAKTGENVDFAFEELAKRLLSS
jgi:small GTP-binding protein